MCKYGVVDTSRAVADIKDWETFYLSARLHKPVLTLISDPEVTLCQSANLQRAVAVGLLTAPQTVSEEDLYLHISKLSYLGDPRLEAAGKLESMVSDNIAAYKELYRPVFHTLGNAVEFEAGVVEVICRQRKGSAEELIALVPKSICLKPELLKDMGSSGRKEVILSGIEQLNRLSVRKQYRHYLKTTHFSTIASYAFRKLKNAVFSRI